jgi:hypothetical protein
LIRHWSGMKGEAKYSAGAGQVEGIAHAMTVAFLPV